MGLALSQPACTEPAPPETQTVRSSLTVAGLVAAYGFDEGTGTATSDDTENAHDAALTGQTWEAGKYGNALDFDGSYLTTAASSLLELDSAMTLSAWVMPTGELSDWRTVIAKEDGPNPEYALYADGNPSAPHAIVTTAGGAYVQAAGNQSLPAGEWSHLAATFDGSNLTLYLNGEPMSSAAAGGPLATSSGPLLIGGSASWGEFFEGVIDEVRVYDRALSLTELKADIHTPINPAGLDTTPPSVMVTAPLHSSAVAGVVQLEAEALDDVSVANVKFFIDGNLLSEDDWPPYTAQWNSVSEAAGAHSLTARAYDAAGNEGTSSAVSVTVLENALVAAYSFDEGSGSELHDITGNGNDATVSGPTWATGKYGGALSFDGDYLTIADASLLDLTTGITLSAWVQPLASHVNWPTIILKEKPGGLSYALLSEWTGTAPSVCIGALGEEDDCVLGGAAPIETWTHLAGTFDGFESKIYVNGELAGSVIQTIPAGVSGEPLRIGGNAIWGNEYFVGLIDEVRVYARSLSETEIQADMNTPMGCGANIDDNNECTADSCDPVFGVTHTPLPSGTSCSDGNACNGGEVCDGAGTCGPAAPLDPDDGNPCTEDSCDPEAGLVHTPVTDGTLCNDNDACTQADACQAGACTGADPIVCTAQDQCHAAGTCDPATGACSNPVLADGTACDDGDACTSGEACTAGTCDAGIPAEVDDGNPCTVDSCDAIGGITHTPVAEGTSCDDGDVCNGAAVCDASGTCQPGTPLTCDDGNACNGIETCQAATGCAAGVPPAVDDGNPCTADSCDPVTGIEHAPVAAGTSCDDGDACNGFEACDAFGVCQVGPGASVDDGNPCTEDSCDPLDGVVHTPVLVGTPCDLDACTVGGTCDSGGFCVSGTSVVPDDGDPCTVETCDPETGVHTSVCTGDRFVTSSVYGSMQFLFSGENPAQQDVDPSALVAKRMAVILGRVVAATGEPIPSVRVTVPGHPEFGFTNTQVDGTYQMVVNGSGQMRVAISKPPYLDVQRQVYVGHGEWIRVPDVALTAADSAVTRVDLSDQTEPFQIHRASPVADSDGIRQGTMLVPAGTGATMHSADGSSTPLETMNIRITEFTVGEIGDEAMPAALPPTTAYTYAFEVNADEAVAAGAPSIEFDQPLIYYVENFLGVPSGTSVPVGSYDRARGAWVPEPNGIALSIVSVVGGAASVDADGDGAADTDAELEEIGITFDERVQLAALYDAGQGLWRVPVHHFTRPFDCNFPSVPEDAVAPPGEPPPPDDDDPPPGEDDEDEPEDPPEPDDKCEVGGRSTIECESRTLRESIPIAGTHLSLNYASDRGTAFRGGLTARITLSGPTVPASLKRIDLRIEVAGRSWELSFPPDPDQFYDFTWDTLDAFGRQMRGKQQVVSTVSYVYDAVYATANGFMLPPVDVIPVEARRESRLSTVSRHLVGVREPGEENWTLSAHHMYDPMSGIIHRGDGRTERALPEQRFVESWPLKSASCCNPSGDGGPVESAWMRDIGAIAVGPDGSIYLTEMRRDIRRIAPDGTIDHFAGAGYGASTGYGGDGGPAKGAKFEYIADVEVGADGSLYVSDAGNYRIRKIDPSGIVTTIAGNGVNGFGGDGGPATEASIRPWGIAVGRHGDLYIADMYNNRVRRVTADGIIHTVGGTGQSSGVTDAEVEALSSADTLHYPADVAEHPDGSFVVIHSPRSSPTRGGRRVRHYTTDGRVRTWTAFLSEWESCSGTHLTEVEVSEAGGLYLADEGCERIIQSLPGGARWRIAEARTWNVHGFQIYRRPALTLYSHIGAPLSIGPDGVYFAGAGRGDDILIDKLYRLTSGMPGFSGLPIVVRSSSRDEVFVFDEEGRHLETRTSAGHLRHAFAYGAEGRLSAVLDEFGNQVSIEGDAGRPSRIVSAFGQATELEYDSSGNLVRVTDPAGHAVAMTYNTAGLLETFTDRRGNTSLMTYDAWGRLASDTDALGGPYTLSSSGDERDRVVTNTTAEGRTTVYRMTQLADGTYRRINTFPDGTQATVEYEASGNRVTMVPSGTVTTTRVWPDPRFGIRRPQTDTTVTLPSGLQQLTKLSRIVDLDDLHDVFSIDEEVTTTSINGKAWVATYDGHALETERVSPEGRWTRSVMNSRGQVIRIENPNVTPITFTYDSRGRLASRTQGARVSTNTYFNSSDSQNGYLHTTANALGQLTTFERDAIGRALSQTAPDDSSTEFDWDANGNLIGVTPPGKPEHNQGFTAVNLQNRYAPPVLSSVPSPATTFDFNLDRQLTTTWRPDAVNFERVYDNAGKLDFIDTPSGIIDYSYFGAAPCVGCAPGSLATLLHPSGVSLAYTYDGHLMTSTTWSGAVSGAIQWTYNNDFRVTTETVTTAGTAAPISFAYDDDGLRTCASPTTCPSGAGAFSVTYDPLLPRPTSSVSGVVTDVFGYNTYGELASYEAFANGDLVFSEVVDAASAPRDQLGRIVERTETNGGTSVAYSYEYDPQGRLIEVYEDGDLAESYTYDDNGNRLSLDTAESNVTATYDDQDRLLTYGDFVYTYTDNGELLTKTDTSTGDITAYQFDVFGNLTRVDLPNGDVIEYLVDGRNRRVGKRVNGTLVQQWLWADQLRIAAELDGAGNLVSRFVYGGKPTTPELVIRGSAVYRVISDHLGSVRALININDPSDVPVRLEYEAFGAVSGAGIGVIPQGFAGGLYDAETGLVRFGARDYDAVVGRWVSKDPRRWRGAQTNFYAYARLDPINQFDPTGHIPEWMKVCWDFYEKWLDPIGTWADIVEILTEDEEEHKKRVDRDNACFRSNIPHEHCCVINGVARWCRNVYSDCDPSTQSCAPGREHEDDGGMYSEQ